MRFVNSLRRRVSSQGEYLERGSVDSYLVLIPTLLIAIALYSCFQYGFSVNYLNSSAIFVGRQIARDPNNEEPARLVEQILKREGIEAQSFHVMRYPIGDRVFLHLLLVGKPIRLGPATLTPSARSLTVLDQW